MSEVLGMDIASGAHFDVRRLRALTVADNCARERLAIKVSQSLKRADVVRQLDQLKMHQQQLRTNKVDNGNKFISKPIAS